MTTTFTATFGNMDGTRITDHSTITINGAVYPIPRIAQGGSRMAPKRIVQAIVSAGYRPHPDYYTALGDGTIVVRLDA